MIKTDKVLTKSSFKHGLECPNKLFFSNNSSEYNNLRAEDLFLDALASGGFQVEEYARLQFPGGVLLEKDSVDDYQSLANKTAELLTQENIVIYEAAFLSDGLFVRSDILVKQGNKIQLIEVKAKSIDPSDPNIFTSKTGKLKKDWKPYLFDLAFQTNVAKLSFPQYEISPFLCLVDKSKTAQVGGLNQLFRVKKNAKHRGGIEVLIDNANQLGDSLLACFDLSVTVGRILEDEYNYHTNLKFSEAIVMLQDIQVNNYYPNWPTSFSACKSCEYKRDSLKENGGKKSGFEHCFRTQHNWSDKDMVRSNIFDIWNLRGSKLMERGIHFKDQMFKEDVKLEKGIGSLSNSERQWIQIQKEQNQDWTEHVNKRGLKTEIDSWLFPLHFIDFETSTVPLPFHEDRKPYEQIAFQFSHHTYHKDGRIEHTSEFISASPGVFPNFEFVEKLYEALKNDNGTIFRYANHEKTILNAIHSQLDQSKQKNKVELMSFIESICGTNKEEQGFIKHPVRDMVDLCEVIKNYYYNPYTYGSISIKDVLPAVLKTSSFIQSKYSKSIGNIQVTSKNFSKDHTWLTLKGGQVISPYKTLPKIFDDLSAEDIDETISGIGDINDGGAALTAYGKLQYTNMNDTERRQITNALKRYCELDTLAMVMIYEHLKSLVKL